MKRTIARLIRDTPFEGLARSIYFRYAKDSNSYYDKETIKIISRKLKETSNCVDIGAHKGLFLKEMLRFAPRGRHMGFEPIPKYYEYLLRKFPSVEVFNHALTDAKGEVLFNHVVNAPGYSGIKQRDYEGLKPKIREIRVHTNTLDNVYPSERKLDFIKIDVEGAEFQVMKGARSTITKSKPIVVFEFGLGAAEYYGTKPEDIYGLFQHCEMGISLLQDFLQDGRILSLEEFKNQYYKSLNYYFIAH
jgi:FkbM family methyltransferase